MEPELQQMAPNSMGEAQMPIQEEKENVLVHMSSEEEEELSRAQGGREIDPELQVPSFTKLWGMISSNPEMQQEIGMMFSQLKGKSKRENEQVEQKVDQFQDQTMGQRPEAFVSPNPEMQELAALGKNGDDTIITMPKDFLFFLWENSPDKEENQTNSATGLPQFGFWSTALSILGGIAGSFIPGIGTTVGAGLGSALGNFGGAYIDESGEPEEEQSSFWSKLGNAGLAGGLGALGSHLFGGSGAAAASAGNGGGATGNQTVDQLLNELISKTPGKSGKNSESNKNLSLLDRIKNLDPLTLAKLGIEGLSSFSAVNSDAKNKKLNRKEELRFWEQQEKNKKEAREWQQKQIEDAYKRNMEMYNLMRQRMGGNLSTFAPKGAIINDVPNENNSLQNYSLLNRFKDGGVVNNDNIVHLKPITKTTYIDGDHEGQKDNVYVDVPEGSYVIDAMTVAAIGNGNSHAGKKIIYDYVNKVKKHPVKNHKFVKCALSSGEVVITPDVITGIGKGDMKKGHKTMELFIKEVRSHKGMKENKIPPASKDLEVYIRSALRKKMRSA